MRALDFTVETIDGRRVKLDDFPGQLYLIVNTASNCVYTSQYRGLEKLHQDYKDSGLVVLGFPCNQFGAQEPGSDTEISSFCERNYGVSFPLFAKLEVNGDKAHPLFQYLKNAAPGLLGSKSIKWNFTKFLVQANGKVLKRYSPQTSPAAIAKDIELALETIAA